MAAKKRVVLTLTAVLLLVASRSAHAQTLLRWKFTPGETLRYVSTLEMTENARIADKIPVTVTMTIGFTYDDTWKIKSVDKAGVATIDRTIDRIQMKIQGPLTKQGSQGALVDFDSASDKEPTGMAMMFAPVARTMVKKVTVLRISPRGEVLDAKPPRGLLESVKKALPGVGSFGDFFSADGLKKAQANIEFPEEPVKKGQTWTHRDDFQFPAPLGTLGVEQKYEYLGTDKQSEPQKIAITVLMLSGEEKPAKEKPGEEKQRKQKPGAPLVKFKANDSSGTIDFDNTQGQILASAMKMKFQAEINVMGKPGTVDMEGTLRIELRPAGPLKEKPKP
jgi:hypothetical protein